VVCFAVCCFVCVVDAVCAQHNLRNGAYPYPDAFAADVRQVFINCRAYNEPASAIVAAAAALEAHFEEQYKQQIPQHLRSFISLAPRAPAPAASASAAAAAADTAEESASASPPEYVPFGGEPPLAMQMGDAAQSALYNPLYPPNSSDPSATVHRLRGGGGGGGTDDPDSDGGEGEAGAGADEEEAEMDAAEDEPEAEEAPAPAPAPAAASRSSGSRVSARAAAARTTASARKAPAASASAAAPPRKKLKANSGAASAAPSTSSSSSSAAASSAAEEEELGPLEPVEIIDPVVNLKMAAKILGRVAVLRGLRDILELSPTLVAERLKKVAHMRMPPYVLCAHYSPILRFCGL
jgi:hypothetical protein